MTRLAALALLAAPVMLGGCGLHPLYAGGAGGPVRSAMQGIEVAPVQGKAGWLLANALRDRLGEGKDQPTRYRLQIALDDKIQGLGLRADNSITRERRTLRARYQLVDMSNNGVVLDATAGSDAGLDVVGSEYATIAAENTAMERLTQTIADKIVARLALFAKEQAKQ